MMAWRDTRPATPEEVFAGAAPDARFPDHAAEEAEREGERLPDGHLPSAWKGMPKTVSATNTCDSEKVKQSE